MITRSANVITRWEERDHTFGERDHTLGERDDTLGERDDTFGERDHTFGERLCGIQRRQLSVLERGGNVTLSTLRKVIGFLPNLEEFTFEQVRMKPTYIDHPPFEWTLFYLHMSQFQQALEELNTTLKTWLANPPVERSPPGTAREAHHDDRHRDPPDLRPAHRPRG